MRKKINRKLNSADIDRLIAEKAQRVKNRTNAGIMLIGITLILSTLFIFVMKPWIVLIINFC